MLKLILCLTNQALHREDVWGSGCRDPCFLDLGTRDEWSASRLWCFTPGTRWIRGWVDDMEKWRLLNLPGFKLRPLSHSSRNQYILISRWSILPFCYILSIRYYTDRNENIAYKSSIACEFFAVRSWLKRVCWEFPLLGNDIQPAHLSSASLRQLIISWLFTKHFVFIKPQLMRISNIPTGSNIWS
jgi:hypothetical protein